MKITKIKIKNMFGISEYEADGKSVELVGQNGSGKTSVIDSIRFALSNRSDRAYIVKNGTSEGEILIEMDNGLVINRKPRINQADYKSIKKDNKEIPSPESFLSELFTELQLNPVKFIQMDSKEQNRIILDLIEFKWDLNWIKEQFEEIPQGVNYEQNILQVLHEIQSEKGYYYNQRHDLNLQKKIKEHNIQEIVKDIPENYQAQKWQSFNLGDIYKKIEEARNNNNLIEKTKQLKDNYTNKIRGFQAEKEIAVTTLDRTIQSEKESLEKEITRYEEIIRANKEKLNTLNDKKQDKLSVIQSEFESKVSKHKAELEAYSKYETLEYVDTMVLTQEAEQAEQMKSHLNEYARMRTMQQEVDQLQISSDKLTAKIELARTLPGEILKTANLPIENLTIDDNGIPLINGLPVSNLSEGEKLNLCIDIAVSKPNNLQILLIDGIEKLSTENRNALYQKCKSKGLQFIATRTDDTPDLTVISF